MKLPNALRLCKICAKSGLFAEIGDDGFCPKCRAEHEKEEAEMKAARERIAAEQAAWEHRQAIEAAVLKATQRRDKTPKFYRGGVMVYYYPRVRAIATDRAAIEQMAMDWDFSVDLTIDGDEIVGLNRGKPVLKMAARQDMCRDWIRRGDPIYCVISNLTEGNEHVTLGFYRDEETRLEGKPYTLCKLTSCRSSDAQDAIAFLDDGEALYLEEDDRGRFCVCAFPFDDIGALPAKFTKYDKSDFAAIIYDHGDEDEDSDVIIPYVRVYLK